MTTVGDLLVEHRASMLRFARSKTRTLADAEDAMQTACVTALSSVAAPTSNPSSWLLGHVLNAQRSAYRKQARYAPDGDDVATLVTVSGGQEASIEMTEAMAVLASMKPQRAEMFRRVAIDGDTNEEVARDLGCTPQSVSWNVKRAREDIIAGAPAVDGRSLRHKLAA